MPERAGGISKLSKIDEDRARIKEMFAALSYRDRVYSATDIRKARDRINRRLDSSWTGMWGTPQHRFKRVEPSGRLRGAPVLDVDPVELLIIRELAATSPAAQFGATPTGTVFTASTFGKSKEHERLYLSGLSPLLDTVAEIFNTQRSGEGGRFFESEGRIVDAADDLVVIHLRTRR